MNSFRIGKHLLILLIVGLGVSIAFPNLSAHAASQVSATTVNIAPRLQSFQALRLRTIRTSDGFVAVRATATTKSGQVRRLASGTEVVCAKYVVGETLIIGGKRSNQWVHCPSVGGYIFSLLLQPAGATTPAPPPATEGITLWAARTSDGFVTVRAQATTKSGQVRRLPSLTEVRCTKTVTGEALTLGGQRSNQWWYCPSVGGYIFGLLLMAGDPPADIRAPTSFRDAEEITPAT